jgi:hypothetical protein
VKPGLEHARGECGVRGSGGGNHHGVQIVVGEQRVEAVRDGDVRVRRRELGEVSGVGVAGGNDGSVA